MAELVRLREEGQVRQGGLSEAGVRTLERDSAA